MGAWTVKGLGRNGFLMYLKVQPTGFAGRLV